MKPFESVTKTWISKFKESDSINNFGITITSTFIRRIRDESLFNTVLSLYLRSSLIEKYIASTWILFVDALPFKAQQGIHTITLSFILEDAHMTSS